MAAGAGRSALDPITPIIDIMSFQVERTLYPER